MELGGQWATDEPELGAADFAMLGAVIERNCGIRMPANKRAMLESRLRRRLRGLELADFGAYCELIASGDPVELQAMLDLATTNKTDFFREPRHFEYLAATAVPALLRRPLPSGFRVWSAACSTGEEAWTLAMVLLELGERTPGFRFTVTASDLCTAVLDEAALGLYDEPRVEPVPLALRHKYLQRRKDRQGPVRIGPTLRQHVRFEQRNLMDRNLERFGPVEVIFCRNVFIYFERDVQRQVLQRLVRALVPGGYVFLGHAESASGFDLPLTQVAPTVYRKDGP
jgi:chemotaxis protein methyltransferase CheR